LDDAIMQPSPAFQCPTTPRDKWTKVDNLGFLKSRGETVKSDILAADAKHAVDILFNEIRGVPPPVIVSADLVRPRDMRRLWWLCSSMFKDLMLVNHDTTTINRTDA
jgi:hypothetical protein